MISVRGILSVREMPAECRIGHEVFIQRLKIAGMLRKKTSYAAITQEIGVSTATISRVSRCLNYGSGGYKIALERMKEPEEKR